MSFLLSLNLLPLKKKPMNKQCKQCYRKVALNEEGFCMTCAILEEEKVWLIWSIEHNGWWGWNHGGYVQAREYAGRYSFKEALKIVKDANIGLHNIPNEAMIHAEDKDLFYD